MNASAKETSLAPFCAASAMYLQFLATEAWRSSHSGSSWVTATRTLESLSGAAASPIMLERRWTD